MIQRGLIGLFYNLHACDFSSSFVSKYFKNCSHHLNPHIHTNPMKGDFERGFSKLLETKISKLLETKMRHKKRRKGIRKKAYLTDSLLEQQYKVQPKP